MEKMIEEKKAGEPVRENKMGTMPVGKLMLSMAWPAILSMIIQALYNVVDSIFVAMVSESALAAVTLVFPVQLLLVAVGIGTGVGVNSVIARRLGEKRFEDADLTASHGFRISFINWAVFALFGLFFARMYMGIYSNSQFIRVDGGYYLQILTICSLFVFVQVNTEKTLQATGNMIMPMLCSLSGALVNIVFDPILIFGIGPFPNMGLVGAAVATVFGQFVSMCLGLVLLFGFKHQVKVHIKGFKFSIKIIEDIYAVAIPAMLMQSIGSVMLFCVNGILAASETAVAVLGSYFRLQSFIFMPVFGLNQGTMPIIGYNYGARNRERLMKTYKLGLATAVIIMGIGVLIFMTLPDRLLMLFSASDNMLAIGVPALRILSLCFLPAAFGIMTVTLFQATGHGILSLWQSLIRQLVGIVPLAWIFNFIGGVSMVWWAWPAAELIGAAYTVLVIQHLYKKEFANL